MVDEGDGLAAAAVRGGENDAHLTAAAQFGPMNSTDLLLNLVTFGAEMAMIFGGVVPYIPQYLNIKR